MSENAQATSVAGAPAARNGGTGAAKRSGKGGRGLTVGIAVGAVLTVVGIALWAVQLSGGMARRVSIVRAMLTSGDAVLLDEPFKGLDDLTREKVMQFVKENLKNRTMILVTHDPRDAKDLAAVKIIEMETEK